MLFNDAVDGEKPRHHYQTRPVVKKNFNAKLNEIHQHFKDYSCKPAAKINATDQSFGDSGG